MPPIEKQSEMMQETSRSFQNDAAILERCRAICLNLEVVKSEGHHFNLLYKHSGPIAMKIEADFQLEKNTLEPIAIIGSACRLPGIRILQKTFGTSFLPELIVYQVSLLLVLI